METVSLEQTLSDNIYPGRGIAVGLSEDGKSAVCAYFIMGRSENSRNRIFVPEADGIRTKAYDEARLEDPSLIIYAPVRVFGNRTIVTNGDQTDTVYDGLAAGKSFEESLRCRTYEPDAPNYTPRISALLHVENGVFDYEMSILKRTNANGGESRFTFSYKDLLPGDGRFIHTYKGDGNPLPSFAGEPESVELSGDIDSFAKKVWDGLNADNRVSLFVRYIDIATGHAETRIINRHC